jgi:carbonic anhydrase
MSSHRFASTFAALALFITSGLAEEHHWTYGGATGPAKWGDMEQEFSACGAGRLQSPVDIRAENVQKADLPKIQFAYKPAPLRIIDTGHSIQVNYPPGSFITVGDHRYQLVQFHFHHPSEEAFAGKRFDMVAHLVHRDADGRLAVVAVPLTDGPINVMVAKLWANLPSRKEAEEKPEGVVVDASELLPADRAYYTLTGSLTTPPCSEGVTWFVLKQPQSVSTGEISRFAQLYPMNARPLQPLNARAIRSSN